nr:MAG TPA: endodeoxyribonuclease I [Caudoviricetes sp.]
MAVKDFNSLKKTNREIVRIVVHCSDHESGSATTIEEIRKDHINNRKWSDIGYHYVIETNGDLEIGRDVDKTPAAQSSYNEKSIALCYVGGHKTINGEKKWFDTRTKAQKETMLKLLKKLREYYPKATICGHNEFTNQKVCPSFDVRQVYGFLNVNVEDKSGALHVANVTIDGKTNNPCPPPTGSTQTNSSSPTIENVNSVDIKNGIPDVIKSALMSYSQQIGVNDWRWLAALSYVESRWNTNAKNSSSGFYGLFQFKQSTIGKGYDVHNVHDQIKVAATNFKNEFNKSKKRWGLNDENAALYAALAHNVGSGGAQFLMENAPNKNVNGMLYVEQNINKPPYSNALSAKSSSFQFLKGSKKIQEVTSYPIKVKQFYLTLKSKYK